MSTEIRDRFARAVETGRATLDRLFHRHPRRRVVDPEEPVLRYGWRGPFTTHMARLSRGHRVACDSTRTKWRRCWMCTKGLPAGRRVRVVPGHRSEVAA